MARWQIGLTKDITWSFPDVLSNIKIELSRDNGSNWETIESTIENNGLYSWVVTGPEATQALIKISGLNYIDPDDGSEIDFSDIVDISDNSFQIIIPSSGTYNIYTYIHNKKRKLFFLTN